MAAKKPTMAQAYKAAAKSKDKGIVGEGKDVLKAAGNSVKQQAEFVGAVGKGAAKGAGAIAKGAEKVAGKVANITVGDVASAPYDFAKNVAKGAGKVATKVGKVLATPAGGSRLGAAMPKKPKAKSDSLETQYAQAQKASAMAQSSMKPFTGTSSPSGSTRFATAMKNREKLNSAMNLRDKKEREKFGATVAGKAKDAKANKARQATDSKYDKVERKIPKRKQLRRGK